MRKVELLVVLVVLLFSIFASCKPQVERKKSYITGVVYEEKEGGEKALIEEAEVKFIKNGVEVVKGVTGGSAVDYIYETEKTIESDGQYDVVIVKSGYRTLRENFPISAGQVGSPITMDFPIDKNTANVSGKIGDVNGEIGGIVVTIRNASYPDVFYSSKTLREEDCGGDESKIGTFLIEGVMYEGELH